VIVTAKTTTGATKRFISLIAKDSTSEMRHVAEQAIHSVACSACAKTPNRCTTISSYGSSTVVHEAPASSASN
jgi:hypothetical protein